MHAPGPSAREIARMARTSCAAANYDPLPKSAMDPSTTSPKLLMCSRLRILGIDEPRHQASHNLKRPVKLGVPSFIQIFSKRVPEEREDMPMIIRRLVRPAVHQTIGPDCEEVPARRSDHGFAEIVTLGHIADAALLGKLPERSGGQRFPLLDASLHELLAR